MREFVVDRAKWHFTVVTISTNVFSQYQRRPEDFCSYWRHFVAGLVAISLVSSLIGILAFLLGMSLYQNPVGFLLGTLIIVLSAATLTGAVWTKHEYHKRRMSADRAPGILSMKYKSWKQKYCPALVYK